MRNNINRINLNQIKPSENTVRNTKKNFIK